jgi:formylglycine-generating enzyme required for sulfatase activity
MVPGGIKIAVITATMLLTFTAIGAPADDASSWLQQRHARFAAYRSAHPNPDTEIAGIKAQTAIMIAANTRPRPATDSSADNEAIDSETMLNSAPLIWRVSNIATELWDGADLPKMIVVPAGEYTMGSPASEANRQANEGPRHRVRIGYSFAVSEYAITVGEYARFVADTHHDGGEACFTIEHGVYRLRGNRDWSHVGFKQSSNNPVGCVNWYDTQAYVAWLSKRTGHQYRLLSEAEYEYINRAGSVSAYWWGDEVGNNRTNCDGCGSALDNQQPMVVGSFAANAFNLYDTTGNSWSWLSDCWNATYAGAPVDGSAYITGDCDLHVMRGGSVHSVTGELRSASRSRHWFSLRNIPVGFRVARTL